MSEAARPEHRRTGIDEGPEGSGAIVYIMGYGRSGSTILDVALGNCAGAVGLGALCNLPRWMELGRTCSCGRPVTTCSLWGRVIDGARLRGREAEMLDLQRHFESYPALARWGLRGFDPERQMRYRALLGRLFDTLEEVTGRSTFVDSSKSARTAVARVLSLQRYSGRRVMAIHLLRNPCAVVWSDHKRAGSPERARRELPASVRAAKTAAQWSVTNAMCRILSRQLGEENVIDVRYEDLMRSPRKELRRICRHAGLDGGSVAEAMAEGGELTTGHKLGGNRVRYAGKIRIRPDFEWSDEMPAHLRWIARVCAGSVAWRWGYA